MKPIPTLKYVSLILIPMNCLLNYNTYGKNFRPVYDTQASHNYCQHDSAIAHAGDILYRSEYDDETSSYFADDNYY